VLLRHPWAALGLALIAIGLVWSPGALVGLGVFVLLAGVLVRAWGERSLDGVELERLLPESRAFPGEALHLTYRVTNRKLIPLPWLEVRDLLPDALTAPALDRAPGGGAGTVSYRRSTHLRWHERVSWSLDLSCSERGYYRLGPARLRSGDGFGLVTKERAAAAVSVVVVYPRTVPLVDLGLPAARPLGDRRGRERIFEDPLRAAGVRDYHPGDPLRRIDWKATARRGELQSRVYEPSTAQHLTVALNVDTLERSWQGYVPELLEASIVVAASVARWAFDARYAVGLLANGAVPDSDRPLRIAPGRAPDQLSRVLEALGTIGPMTLTALAAQLEDESRALPLGSTLAVITAQMPEELAAVLRRLDASGQRVVVLAMAGDDWSELLGAVPVRHVDRRAFESGEQAAPVGRAS